MTKQETVADTLTNEELRDLVESVAYVAISEAVTTLPEFNETQIHTILGAISQAMMNAKTETDRQLLERLAD